MTLAHPMPQETTPPLAEGCVTLACRPAGVLGVCAQLLLSFWSSPPEKACRVSGDWASSGKFLSWISSINLHQTQAAPRRGRRP